MYDIPKDRLHYSEVMNDLDTNAKNCKNDLDKNARIYRAMSCAKRQDNLTWTKTP